MLCGLWDPSSLTRNQTYAPCIGSLDFLTTGPPVTSLFLPAFEGNAVLNASDTEMKRFAKEYLGYNHDKGLDFVARFNGTYVIGEAKFLTDFGGHQDAQFADAISTLSTELRPNKLNATVIKIAICDGVLYIPGRNKMHRYLTEHDDKIILSSLLLREFLYSI